MNLGNLAFELADRRAEQERAEGIRRAQGALRAAADRPDRLVCDCGAEISEARRAAMPGTDKCIDCATFAERQRRRA